MRSLDEKMFIYQYVLKLQLEQNFCVGRDSKLQIEHCDSGQSMESYHSAYSTPIPYIDDSIGNIIFKNKIYISLVSFWYLSSTNT